MLRDLLNLLQCAGGMPLSAAAVAEHLGLAPEVAQHMLNLLVQRGRLVQVEGGCAGCEVCPLHRFCAGASRGDVDLPRSHGYRIR